MIMRRIIAYFLCVTALLLGASCTKTDNSVVVIDESPEVDDATNTGCVDRTRAAGSDKQTIVLTKEGDVISCELDNCIGNCSTSYFDVNVDYFKGVGTPDSFFVDVQPVVKNPSDCTCPFNVYFTIRNVKSDCIFLDCKWFTGIVSFKDASQVVLDPAQKNADIDGMRYQLVKPGNIAGLSLVENREGEVRVPSTVSYDGEDYTVVSFSSVAFSVPEVTKLILPRTIRMIGGGEELGNPCVWLPKLETIEVEPCCRLLSSVDGVLYDAKHKSLWCCPVASDRTEYTVIDGVEKICQYAFYNCSNLKSIRLPESVTIIKTCAFAGCKNLESIYVMGKLNRNVNHFEAFLYMESTPTLYVPESEVEFIKKIYKGPVQALQ